MGHQSHKKPRPIKFNGPTWKREVQDLIEEWAPAIIQCADCTHAVVQGYCCRWCGSDEPDREA